MLEKVEQIEHKDLHILLTFMNEGILVFDDSQIISYANPKAHEILGLAVIKGMSLADIAKSVLNEDGTPATVEGSGVLDSLQANVSPPDKVYKSLITHRWMTGSSVPVIEEGKIIKAFVLFHDITDLKNSEIKKIELLKEREKFFSMITHDLKNPLTAISLAAHLIRRNSPDMPLTLKHIQTILASTTFMSHLLDELLTSLQTEKIVLKYEDVDIRESLKVLEKHFELQLQIKQLQLNIHCGNITCQCDRAKLFQVLMNLMGNAIKFSKPGGIITMNLKESKSHCLISIKDCGPGIPKDQLAKIFEPYYQMRDEDTLKGHGLGLTIVKHIVKAHHGRVWAESSDTYGSTFHVMLPKFESKGFDDRDFNY